MDHHCRFYRRSGGPTAFLEAEQQRTLSWRASGQRVLHQHQHNAAYHDRPGHDSARGTRYSGSIPAREPAGGRRTGRRRQASETRPNQRSQGQGAAAEACPAGCKNSNQTGTAESRIEQSYDECHLGHIGPGFIRRRGPVVQLHLIGVDAGLAVASDGGGPARASTQPALTSKKSSSFMVGPILPVGASGGGVT